MIATFCVYDCGDVYDITGFGLRFTVIFTVTGIDAGRPVLKLTVIITLPEYVAVGVPEITPVAEFKLNPEGKLPLVKTNWLLVARVPE